MNTDLEAVVRYRRDHAAAEAERGRTHADRNRDPFWDRYARLNDAIVRELTDCLVQAGLEKPASWHHEAQADREVAAETELERQAAWGK